MSYEFITNNITKYFNIKHDDQKNDIINVFNELDNTHNKIIDNVNKINNKMTSTDIHKSFQEWMVLFDEINSLTQEYSVVRNKVVKLCTEYGKENGKLLAYQVVAPVTKDIDDKTANVQKRLLEIVQTLDIK